MTSPFIFYKGPPSLSFFQFAEPKPDTTSRHFPQRHSSLRFPKAKSLSLFRYQLKGHLRQVFPDHSNQSSLLPITSTTLDFISFINLRFYELCLFIVSHPFPQELKLQEGRNVMCLVYCIPNAYNNTWHKNWYLINI